MEKVIVEIPQQDITAISDWNTVIESGVWGITAVLSADRYGEIVFCPGVKEALERAAKAGLEVGIEVNIRCADPFAAHKAAAETAKFCSELKEAVTLPVTAVLSEKGSSRLISQGKDGLTDTAIAFMFETERNGRQSMIKVSHLFGDTYLDMNRLKERRLWADDASNDSKTLEKKWGTSPLFRSISNADRRYIPALFKYAQSAVISDK